jgi:type IV pilus assembly protein PilV
MNARRIPFHFQRGVGLIEVLIAVLVLSVGMLGLAGLQVRTLRNNQGAMQRGMAVIETHGIVDAMRADRERARQGQYDLAMGAADPTGTTFRAQALSRWRQNIRTALGSDASGSVDCTTFDCTIIIRWDDSRGTGGSATMELRTDIRL